ncbi:hypothetical protein [Streptomyces sp. ISL-90]|uniref:hypothetical protein n=1 Tax=Agromyces sp. ISL-38 TaxID=2819107 RepID=UPI001BE6C574|nr:hypothetical protein [Streptomyces sp. ISL-90]
MHRLESNVDVELGARAHGDEALSHRVDDWHSESLLAHLTRTVQDVAHVQAER